MIHTVVFALASCWALLYALFSAYRRWRWHQSVIWVTLPNGVRFPMRKPSGPRVTAADFECWPMTQPGPKAFDLSRIQRLQRAPEPARSPLEPAGDGWPEGL